MALLISCAQQVPLTGGEKDEEAPKEVESFPKNGSTNFNANEIIIEFDEFIQTQNLTAQLIVSPLMETPPEVMVKNKKLVIKLKDTLSPNTTYSLNFGNSITDITENNPSPNYKYVFSTGDYLDSLTYSGMVINAEDLTPVEKIYVLLYNQYEDSVPLKEKPRYIAISDKDGKFNITNIAVGNYKIFAINDINSNYLFDLPNEQIAFEEELISIKENNNGNVLNLFEEKNNVNYILKSEHQKYGEIKVYFNSPSSIINATPLNNDMPDDWGIWEFNETNDTIAFWLKPAVDLEELSMEFSNNSGVIDTVSFFLIDKKKFKDSTLVVSSNTSGKFDLNKKMQLELNRPFVNFYKDSIILIKDSIDVSPRLNIREISQRKILIEYDFDESTKYQLIIPPNTFKDLYGIVNDTIKYAFTTKKMTDYGTIALNINPNFSENYIIQLRKNKKVIQQDFLTGINTLNYKFLAPGNYDLKLIIDTDKNKKWTTGNYLNHQQPEKIIYYEKEIIIRANWDNDINWIIKE